MDLFKNAVEAAMPYVANKYVAAIGGVAVAGLLFKRVKAARARSAFFDGVKQQKKGVVHLYAIPRPFKGTPHLAANVVKVEAFLRANKIPYVMNFTFDGTAYSPTETMPFIAIDGELIGESQFCVDAIKKRFNLPMDEGLDASQQAVATMIRRTLDLSTYAHQSRTTFVDNFPIMKALFIEKFAPMLGMPSFAVGMFANSLRKNTINRLNTYGIGWLDDERYQIEYVRDVQAMSALVAAADKKGHKFLFGDKPTSADCLLFGFVSSASAMPAMQFNNKGYELMRTDSALQAYAKRFQATFYPDLEKIAPCGSEPQSFLSYP